ncbi:unnamed protein product [Moneuplotes crassus]|uniref:Uncharacterized protein n=1 Tax=Euplotes crassus TaxID=5936 RepID=A0AAD1UDZ2_EUPCR|nr:unnamed protein product [Moneuplotes crassus]
MGNSCNCWSKNDTEKSLDIKQENLTNKKSRKMKGCTIKENRKSSKLCKLKEKKFDRKNKKGKVKKSPTNYRKETESLEREWCSETSDEGVEGGWQEGSREEGVSHYDTLISANTDISNMKDLFIKYLDKDEEKRLKRQNCKNMDNEIFVMDKKYCLNLEGYGTSDDEVSKSSKESAQGMTKAQFVEVTKTMMSSKEKKGNWAKIFAAVNSKLIAKNRIKDKRQLMKEYNLYIRYNVNQILKKLEIPIDGSTKISSLRSKLNTKFIETIEEILKEKESFPKTLHSDIANACKDPTLNPDIFLTFLSTKQNLQPSKTPLSNPTHTTEDPSFNSTSRLQSSLPPNCPPDFFQVLHESSKNASFFSSGSDPYYK